MNLNYLLDEKKKRWHADKIPHCQLQGHSILIAIGIKKNVTQHAADVEA